MGYGFFNWDGLSYYGLVDFFNGYLSNKVPGADAIDC